MANGQLNLVSTACISGRRPYANIREEHTLLVTETGVEVLTARLEDSPGGPIPSPRPTTVIAHSPPRTSRIERHSRAQDDQSDETGTGKQMMSKARQDVG